jgi:hypothetical protein
MNEDETKMLETYRALCDRNKELLRTGAELALRAERAVREQYFPWTGSRSVRRDEVKVFICFYR